MPTSLLSGLLLLQASVAISTHLFFDHNNELERFSPLFTVRRTALLSRLAAQATSDMGLLSSDGNRYAFTRRPSFIDNLVYHRTGLHQFL